MAITIAFANQKGGVGKTTTAVNIADLLSQAGYRVLLIDLDSQGNVAPYVGLPSGNDLAAVLRPISPVPLQRAGLHVTETLRVLRSDKETAALKLTLAGMDMREFVLEQILTEVDEDVVIFDTPPSLDMLNTAALVASDYLIVPTELEQFAVKGVMDVIGSMRAIRRICNCQMAGVIPTMWERTTKEHHAQLMNLAEEFKKLVYPPIPIDIRCAESTRAGMPLSLYDPACRALCGIAIDGRSVGGYYQVAKRIREELL